MSSVEWAMLIPSVCISQSRQVTTTLHTHCQCSSYLNGVLPLGEVDLALPLLLSNAGSLVLGQAAAQVTGEFGAEVERHVLLVLVEET